MASCNDPPAGAHLHDATGRVIERSAWPRSRDDHRLAGPQGQTAGSTLRCDAALTREALWRYVADRRSGSACTDVGAATGPESRTCATLDGAPAYVAGTLRRGLPRVVAGALERRPRPVAGRCGPAQREAERRRRSTRPPVLSGGSPREGARSEARAEQRLAAGGRRLPRPEARHGARVVGVGLCCFQERSSLAP